jgi:hypothetical protein
VGVFFTARLMGIAEIISCGLKLCIAQTFIKCRSMLIKCHPPMDVTQGKVYADFIRKAAVEDGK